MASPPSTDYEHWAKILLDHYDERQNPSTIISPRPLFEDPLQHAPGYFPRWNATKTLLKAGTMRKENTFTSMSTSCALMHSARALWDDASLADSEYHFMTFPFPLDDPDSIYHSFPDAIPRGAPGSGPYLIPSHADNVHPPCAEPHCCRRCIMLQIIQRSRPSLSAVTLPLPNATSATSQEQLHKVVDHSPTATEAVENRSLKGEDENDTILKDVDIKSLTIEATAAGVDEEEDYDEESGGGVRLDAELGTISSEGVDDSESSLASISDITDK